MRLDKDSLEKGITNPGSLSRLKYAINKARESKNLSLAFIGGSITEGSLSSSKKTCYAYRVYAWLSDILSDVKIKYTNAGIGGTCSCFGASRAAEDILSEEPDIVIVDFSVNDKNEDFYKETYEGLIRKIYYSKTNPAIVCLCNTEYDNGFTCEDMHKEIITYYNIPAVSVRSGIYEKMIRENVDYHELSPDGLHPNDLGHSFIAELIIHLLKKAFADESTLVSVSDTDCLEQKLPAITANAYETAYRIQNSVRPKLMVGFAPDESIKKNIQDRFKNGFAANIDGAFIEFDVAASEIAIQYKKHVKKPARRARLILDGDRDNSILLDGNFDEDWGDHLFLQPVLVHGNKGMHTVRIEIIPEENENQIFQEFCLVSIIVNKI